MAQICPHRSDGLLHHDWKGVVVYVISKLIPRLDDCVCTVDMSVTRLSKTQVQSLVHKLPLWKIDGEGMKLRRSLTFTDFNQAWGFMSRVALYADKVCDIQALYMHLIDRPSS